MIRLSIITINFNNASGLRETIVSVINQTFSDFEYIIIDGGSTDNSVDIIKEYSKKITYWVTETDKGIYNAMNKGIKVANGEYLQFLNSGDYLANKFVLDKVFKEKNNSDIIFGNMIKVFSNGTTIKDKGPENNDITLKTFFTKTLNHSSAFINHNLFSQYGLYDEELKIVSDWKFFLISCGLNQANIIYKDIDIVYFDMNGISNINLELRKSEREKVLKNLMPRNLYIDYTYYEKESGIIFSIEKHVFIYIIYKKMRRALFKLSKIMDMFF
ncbi:MAG: hypothetical protein RIQ61_1457 [Bacteroidota bacterium]|jgi:glycosyltransferase involved in cell wall biosynthesis